MRINDQCLWESVYFIAYCHAFKYYIFDLLQGGKKHKSGGGHGSVSVKKKKKNLGPDDEIVSDSDVGRFESLIIMILLIYWCVRILFCLIMITGKYLLPYLTVVMRGVM